MFLSEATKFPSARLQITLKFQLVKRPQGQPRSYAARFVPPLGRTDGMGVGRNRWPEGSLPSAGSVGG
jgi:hypothetical protein